MENKSNKSLTMITIIAMMFLYAMISFVTNLAAPVGKIWALSNEGASNANFLGMLGNMMNFGAYLFMGIPAGKLLTKVGYKKTALIAVAVGTLGLLTQWLSGIAASFYVYLLGAFICGFSVCMLNTVVNPMLNLLGGGGNRGNQLNLIGGTLNSLSGSLTPMLVGAIIGSNLAGKTITDVNPVLFMAIAVFVVVFAVIWFTPLAEPQTADDKTVFERSPWAFRHLVMGVIAIFIYVGIEVGVPAALISYLTPEYGFATAGFVAGLYWILMLVGRTIGSAIGGKVSSRTMVTCVSSLAVVLMTLAMVLGNTIMVPFIADWSFSIINLPIAAPLIVLVGLCTSVMWGCIFNMAVEGLGKYTAQASGIFMMMVVGGGVLPLIQGVIADHTDILTSYIVFVAGAAYILLYAVIWSKNVNTDIKVD